MEFLKIGSLKVDSNIIFFIKWFRVVNTLNPQNDKVTKIDLWSTFRYVNDDSFEKIAEQRGGLIQIDDRTKTMTSLSTARLEVNQNNISAIPSIVYFQDQESRFYDPTKPTIQPNKSWTDREIQSKATGRPQLIDVKNTKLEKKV